jgi:protein phosphatase
MGISLAGVPQALNQLLAPVGERPTPQQALALLKSLSAPPLPVLEVGAATSVGLNPDRPYNEDAFAYRLERVQAHANHTLLLRACVADGMGGMAAGERASQAAVETFVAPAPPHPLDDPQAQADWAVRLVWEANAAVLQALGGRDGGCTISALLLVGARYALAHVGDTRAYSWSGQGLRQISRDHSLVGAMLASGMITPEEAQGHPDRNKVLRSLGSLRQPQEGYVDGLLEGPTASLAPGEALLLVSDGVWGEVSDHRMAEILSGSPTPQAAAQALVAAALEAGAPDNATALIVRRVS